MRESEEISLKIRFSGFWIWDSPPLRMPETVWADHYISPLKEFKSEVLIDVACKSCRLRFAEVGPGSVLMDRHYSRHFLSFVVFRHEEIGSYLIHWRVE